MIKQYGNIITSFLLKEDIIKIEDKEIYMFGVVRILKYLTVLIGIGLIAIIYGLWIESLCLFIGFIPIRQISGGYHAETVMKCNLITYISYIINMLVIKITYNVMGYLPFAVLCIATIIMLFIFGPVDHKNMIFSEEEKRLAKKKGRLVLMLVTLLTVILIFVKGSVGVIPYSIMLGSFTASLSILLGSMKRKGENNEYRKIID